MTGAGGRVVLVDGQCIVSFITTILHAARTRFGVL